MSRLSAGFANEYATLAERVVTLASGTLKLESYKHANRLLLIGGGAAPFAITLPLATGSGDVYEFLTTAAQTSGSITVSASHGTASNVIVGTIAVSSSSDSLLVRYSSTANDIITLNGTTQGAVGAGDRLKLIDVAPNTWRVVDALFLGSGNPATPFSG